VVVVLWYLIGVGVNKWPSGVVIQTHTRATIQEVRRNFPEPELVWEDNGIEKWVMPGGARLRALNR